MFPVKSVLQIVRIDRSGSNVILGYLNKWKSQSLFQRLISLLGSPALAKSQHIASMLPM